MSQPFRYICNIGTRAFQNYRIKNDVLNPGLWIGSFIYYPDPLSELSLRMRETIPYITQGRRIKSFRS